jgi:hypothetical protein
MLVPTRRRHGGRGGGQGGDPFSVDDGRSGGHVDTQPRWLELLRRYWLLAVALIALFLTTLPPLPSSPPAPSAPSRMAAYTRPLYSRFSHLRDVVQKLPHSSGACPNATDDPAAMSLSPQLQSDRCVKGGELDARLASVAGMLRRGRLRSPAEEEGNLPESVRRPPAAPRLVGPSLSVPTHT